MDTCSALGDTDEVQLPLASFPGSDLRGLGTRLSRHHPPPALIKLLLDEGQSLDLPLLSQALGPLPHLGLSLQEGLLLAGHLALVLRLLCLQQRPESERGEKEFFLFHGLTSYWSSAGTCTVHANVCVDCSAV